VASDLAKLGIKMDIKALHVSTVIGITSRQTSSATVMNWQTNIWGNPYPPEYDYFANTWQYYEQPHYGKWSSIVGWNNQTLGNKLAQLQALPEGNATRDALIQETQGLFAAELPEIPLYMTISPGVYRMDRFTGWDPDAGYFSHGGITPMNSLHNFKSLQPV